MGNLVNLKSTHNKTVKPHENKENIGASYEAAVKHNHSKASFSGFIGYVKSQESKSSQNEGSIFKKDSEDFVKEIVKIDKTKDGKTHSSFIGNKDVQEYMDKANGKKGSVKEFFNYVTDEDQPAKPKNEQEREENKVHKEHRNREAYDIFNNTAQKNTFMSSMLRNLVFGGSGSELNYDTREFSGDSQYNQDDEVISPTGSGDGYDAVKIALSQLGHTDDAKFNESGHWCAAFVTWAYENVFGKGNCPWQKGGFNAHSVEGLKEWGQSVGKYRQTQNFSAAKAGDMIIFQNGASHVGMVTKVDPDGTIHTVEGNTHGGMVAENTYHPGQGWANKISGYVSMS